jgi:hypothetical protein
MPKVFELCCNKEKKMSYQTKKQNIVVEAGPEGRCNKRSNNKRSNNNKRSTTTIDIIQLQRIKEKELLNAWKKKRDAEKTHRGIMRNRRRDLRADDETSRFTETIDDNMLIC